MTFGGWGFANPAGLWLALLALPIIALHILKPRRVRRMVSAVMLWNKVERPVTAAKPWQRLIPSWLLAAQVLAALLLAVAVARPIQLSDEELADHTIFVIDASSSMTATDGEPTRIDQAVERALALRDEMPAGGEASLITAGPNARALLTRSVDADAFAEALGRITAGQGEADFTDAFALAAGLNTGDRPTRVVFISDGGVAPDDLRLVPEGTRYEKVGESATNRGISQLVVEPTADGMVARLAVRHYGGPAATVGVRVDVDGVTVDRSDVTLEPNEVENLSFPIPPGDKVEAFLDSEDAYDLDDRLVATVGRRSDLDVLVVGPPNAFLDTALSVIPGVTVTRESAFETDPEAGEGDGYGAYDLVIADRVRPPDGLGRPAWVIAAPGGGLGVTASGEVDRPALTLIDSSSGLVSGLDLSELLIARSQAVEVPADAEIVLGAESAPLLVRVRPGPSTGGVDAVYQTFALAESNLPLQAVYPVMVDRILTELSRSVVPPARLPVGSVLPVDPRVEARVTDPNGTTTSIAPGAGRLVADRVGFWQIDQGEGSVLVAVNPITGESAIQPAPDLPIATEFDRADGIGTKAEIPLLPWVLAFLLAVMAAEWLLARRRIGVNRRQWRWAEGLRAAIALALVVALSNPVLNRPANDPATIFVLDASASTAGQRSVADDYVVSALGSMEEGARAGVVAFGGNARLENLVSADPAFSGLSVQVDADATDLAAAVRLGAASLPNDARGRLVVITDGRSTTGDLGGEIARLAEDGIPVDLVNLDRGSTADVAVASISVPSTARVGDRVTVTAKVFASVAGPTDVVLLREGREIARQTVDLEVGDNPVAFTDVVDDQAEAVARYQVEVESAADRVGENNRAFAAVPISGAAKVLVVDGSSSTQDQAAPIESALDAVGLAYDTRRPDSIPPVDALVQYSSIVMVDVDRFELSSADVEALTTAVRGLGRGLVVIGGNRSYALGGYLGSDLEELLPVVSEVTDPLRRQTVAEVFAIDTSGSMGACHCDEQGMNGLGGGNRINGGVSKTAIARNATAKAIAALSATDEVGVVTMNAFDDWVLDLQPGPSQDMIDQGLSRLNPDGPTDLTTGLDTAADQLRESKASLKHIILFSDGFTEPGQMALVADRAAALWDNEGITVSVVATGEGAAEELRPIAEAGGGRFYPGRNLEQIPDLLVQEAVVASRSFINEGRFSPVITSNARTVSGLDAAPVIEGYLATTAKPTARVDLRIGPDNDPLLTSWQAGLGRVTAWTSDSGNRWNKQWAAWDGYPDFWATVIKETFPTGADGGGVAATVDGDTMSLTLEGVDAWADGARAVATITGPDGESREVTLERVDGETFTAATAVDAAGVYAVGATVFDGEEAAWTGVGLSARSYPAEFSPETMVDPALGRLASATGGRVDPPPTEAFAVEATTPGTRPIDLARWMLWFAVLAWPLAVAVSRLAWRRGVLATVESRAAGTVRELQRRLPRIDRPHRSAPSSEPQSPEPRSSEPPSSITPPSAAAPAVVPEPAPGDSDVGVGPDAGGGGGAAGGTTLEQLLREKRKS